MDRLYVIAPALLGVSFWVLSMTYFAIRWLLGRPPGPASVDRRTHSRFFAFFMHYFVWLLDPLERGLKSLGVTPNTITLTSIAVSAGSGAALVFGYLATAGWLLILAGGLDVLDGRLARATNKQSQSGAFLDSVSDRWSELLVFTGFAVHLRHTSWLIAVVGAMAASMMVSFTRAQGEAKGLRLDGGHMQRPERIAIIATATLLGAWFEATGMSGLATTMTGGAMTLVAVGASATALRRFRSGLAQHRRADAAVPRPVERFAVAPPPARRPRQ